MTDYQPEIKICGVCSVADAQLTLKYGAQYLGLIFVQSSPRYVDPLLAQSIAESCDRQRIKIVGVFQNSPLEEMENIASSVGLDYFQLHGNESLATCSILSRPVIKTFQIADKPLEQSSCITLSLSDKDIDHCLAVLEQYRPYCRHFLFDRSKDYNQADWLNRVSQELRLIEDELGDYFLAGGLNANNIQIVLEKLKPSIIDIASGVEQAVRIKSESLIKEFCSKIQGSNTVPLSSQSGTKEQ